MPTSTTSLLSENCHPARLLLPDKGQVEIEDDCFNIVNSGPHDFAMPIRLVMDM